ncbi:MAG: hypothetical protein H0V45_06190 [Actinobacteria bacterium]|nr:hypothetical protein [Actinomycetota bacterium]
MKLRLLLLPVLVLVLAVGGVIAGAQALTGQELDPARNLSLPCEAVSTPGLVPRSAKNIAHVANACGFVGTDVEFQSRTAADGTVHDYAFIGSMGAGLRIFDVTDPAHPVGAGAYTDPGWEVDIQVRGDRAAIGFDPVIVGINVSACLRQKAGNATKGGIDILRLDFDPQTASFSPSLVDCYLNNGSGGAHNVTMHPSGEWLSVDTASSGLEVVDLRGPTAVFNRKLPVTLVGSVHDVSFSADGNTMYTASPGQGTYVVDVTNVLPDGARQIAFIPNNTQPGGSANPKNTTISHQADVSSDGAILGFTDERGGGLTQTSCNTDPNGVIGGIHWWALQPIGGLAQTADASPSTPRRLGTWFYPNPGLALDLLAPALATIGRAERACTIHMFRNGGTGSVSPGPIAPGYDGVSRLGPRELVVAHYGAGVWNLDFSGPPSAADGIVEDFRTDWGNTRGWNVMPGAETWSAKEYKGYVYTGDMGRGFDVYALTSCSGVGCLVRPTNTPGRAKGGGQAPGEPAELSILSGPSKGGKATFGFDVAYVTGQAAPTGTLTFHDKAAGRKVEATAIDSLTIAGAKASITGRATVDGVPGISFFAEVEDVGKEADAFRIVLGDGYAAGGILLKGNIEVTGGLVAP